MIRRPPRSTPFPTRRSSDLLQLRPPFSVRNRAEPDNACGPSPPERKLHPLRRKSHNPDRKSTRLNSSHSQISYAVFCLKKKKHYSQYSFAQDVAQYVVQTIL